MSSGTLPHDNGSTPIYMPVQFAMPAAKTKAVKAYSVPVQSPIAGRAAVALLGTGSFGNVYRTRNTTTNQQEALKLQQLTAANAGEAAALEAVKEGCATNHVLCLRDVVPVEAQALVTDLMEGGTLADRINMHVPATPEQMEAYTNQLLDAVEYIHARGVYHRDIKPNNVALSPSAKDVTLLDFGLACSACNDVRTLMGTPPYLWPPVRAKMVEAMQTGVPQEVSNTEWAANDRYAAAKTLAETALGRFTASGKEAAAALQTLLWQPWMKRVLTNLD